MSISQKSERKDFFLGLFGIILIGYLFWLLITNFVAFLERANPSISAAIIGGMATLLAAVYGVLYTQTQIKKRSIEEAHRVKKVEMYENLLDLYSRLISDTETTSIKKPSEQEIADFVLKFKKHIILWGSPDVINAQLDFQSHGNKEDQPLQLLLAINTLYKAVRKDLGLSNKGLNKDQLIKLYLSDPDSLDTLKAQ